MPKARSLSKKRVEKTVFSTPWFKLIEKRTARGGDPYYAIRTLDYVSIVTVTPEKTFVLVRQFRPAVGRMTLELPAGHVEPGQTPAEAAASEVFEETGCRIEQLECLGKLAADTGRMENSLWCYWAVVTPPAKTSPSSTEPGVKVVMYNKSLSSLLSEKDFCCAPNVAAVMLAVAKNRLSLAEKRGLNPI